MLYNEMNVYALYLIFMVYNEMNAHVL